MLFLPSHQGTGRPTGTGTNTFSNLSLRTHIPRVSTRCTQEAGVEAAKRAMDKGKMPCCCPANASWTSPTCSCMIMQTVGETCASPLSAFMVSFAAAQACQGMSKDHAKTIWAEHPGQAEHPPGHGWNPFCQPKFARGMRKRGMTLGTA